MKPLTISCLFVLTVALPAQEEAPALAKSSAQVLQQQIRAAATLSSAEYRLEWRWPRSTSGTATTQRSGGLAMERADGSWHGDVLRVHLEREDLEVVHGGRHAIMRPKNGDWQMASLSSSPQLAFLPDPQRLLLALAETRPDVTVREIVEVDGRAIERFGATLGTEQMDLLVTAGVLHDPNPMGGAMRRMRAGGRGRMKAAAAAPIDVVIDVDVESCQLQRVQLRTMVTGRGIRAMMKLMRGRPGVAQNQAGAAPEAAPKKVNAGEPLRYEQGFPVRDTAEKMTYVFNLTMRKHGALPAVQLDAAQKRLLVR